MFTDRPAPHSYTLSLHDALPILVVFRPVIAAVTGTRREMAELREGARANSLLLGAAALMLAGGWVALTREGAEVAGRSEEHTSELQSRFDLVCRLLLEKKKKPSG